MMKNAQHISTVFPISRSDDRSDVTTSFKPGALLINLSGLKVRMMRKIFSKLKIFTWFLATRLITMSIRDTITRKKSIIFQILFR